MMIRTLRNTLIALIALSIPSALAQKARPHSGSATPQATTAPATEEQLFVPLPVCRAFYTASSSGAIAANGSQNFYIAGSGSQFGSQGGNSSGCGVPTGATSVAISFTAFNTTGAGGLVAYAQGTTRPTVGRVLSYQGGQPATGTAIIPLANNQITLTALSSATQAAGDVTGYFIPQIEAYINRDGTIYSSTTRILSSSRSSAGNYSITTDSNTYDCAVHVTSANFGIATAYPSSNNIITVQTYSFSNGSPVAADAYFNVSVHC